MSFPSALLFDFDGVIVNSEPLHYRAFRQALIEEKLDIAEEEYYSELIGLDDRGSFKHIFAKRGIPVEPGHLLRILARKSQAMMRQIHMNQYRPLTGVEELVRGLWRSYPLAICSASLREEIEVMLEGVSLRDCFCEIVAGEDVSAPKPDPQGYLLAMRRISERIKKPLRPQDCLVIEDAPRVIESVKRHGFRTMGVTSSHFADSFVAAGADWIVPNLDPDAIMQLLPGLKLIR